MGNIPGDRRIATLADLATVDAAVGERVFVEAEGGFVESVPAVYGGEQAGPSASELTPIAWRRAAGSFGPFPTIAAFRAATPPSALTSFVIDGVGTCVYRPTDGAGVEDNGVTIFKPTSVDVANPGRVYLTSKASGESLLSSTEIQPGAGVTSVPTVAGSSPALPYTVPASSLTSIEVAPSFSAGGSKIWTSRLRGTVKRIGTGTATVTSQALDAGGELTASAWSPQLAVVAGAVQLQVTADSTDIIVPRGRVEIISTNMANDPAAPVHDTTWLRAQVDAIITSGLISQFTDPTIAGGKVTAFPGTNGHTAVPTGAVQFDAGTIGAGGRVAIVGTHTGSAPSGLYVDVATAVRTIIVVTAFPTTPASTYNVLVATGDAASHVNDAALIATGTSALQAKSGWTPTIDNVATSNIGTVGGVHLIIWENGSNTETRFDIGWQGQINAYEWPAAQSYFAVCSGTLSTQQKTDLYNLLAVAGTGFYV